MEQLRCSYCGSKAKFAPTSTHLYGQDYGPVWECKPCVAWVGCHKGTKKPLGTPANAKDRHLRQIAHAKFDALWKKKIEKTGMDKSVARGRAYIWLAGELGIPVSTCHIGMMHGERIESVIAICTPPYGKKKPKQEVPVGQVGPAEDVVAADGGHDAAEVRAYPLPGGRRTTA